MLLTPSTFDYCFDGVEEGSIVAISTLGCKKAKRNFLVGYEEMKKRIRPIAIICFDKPFDEIKDVRPDIHTMYVDIFASRNIDDFLCVAIGLCDTQF